MARFFVSRDDIQGDIVYIRDSDARHIRQVLRMVPGERLTVCDGAGMDYHGHIDAIDKDMIIVKITESEVNRTEPPVEITLYQGIPKSDKMDYIIQKCTELGIRKIVPVLTERTVVKLSADNSGPKITRWRRIAAEAAKQCQRGRIPDIAEPCGFAVSVEQASREGMAIIPYENEKSTGIKSIVDRYRDGGISILIGPEGGFSEREIGFAVESGIIPVTLGPRILRTETAGVAALTVLMYEFGDLG